MIIVLLVASFVPLPGYRPEARILPLVVAIPTLLLAVANMVRLIMLRRRARVHVQPSKGAPAASAEQATSLVVAIGWVLAAGLLVLTLGLLIGSLVFIPAFMRVYGRQSLWLIALVTTGIVGLLYVVFVRGLNIGYYPGMLG